MTGRELIPPGRDGDDGEAPTLVLPATIAAAHLAACATDLAADTAPGRVTESVGGLDELAELAGHLVAGQHQLAVALEHLAAHLHRRGAVLPDAVASAQLSALAEVLRAAGMASGHAAEALAESGPVLDLVRESGQE
ncbi:MAG TPA: hypothetical protein VG756_00310 [Pseudonocardiaceae bacterium]|nr:hypothetical protein [Pseudonocardiaceae bacterium]